MKDKLLNILAQRLYLSPLGNKESLIGTYNNYKLTITAVNYRYTFTLPVKVSADYTKVKLLYFLDNLKSEFKKISDSSYVDSTIILTYVPKGNREASADELTSILDKLTRELSFNGLLSCCGLCGEEIETNPFSVNGAVLLCCPNCQSQINQEIYTQQEAIKESPNNVVGGIIGSLIGSLLGVVVWLLISYMGYIASIGGLVIAIGCIRGYKLLGGKLNISGIIITSIITILMVYLATYLSVGISVYSEVKDYGIGLIDSMKEIPYFMEVPAVRSDFFKNLTMGYVLTAIGSVSYFIKQYKDSNYKIETEELHY